MPLHKKNVINLLSLIWSVIIGVLGCVLGIFLGIVYNGQPSFENIISILGLVLAASSLMIAFKALTTWQDQFKYEQKYKDLTELEDAYIKWLRAFRRHYYAYLAAARKGVQPEDTFNLPESIDANNASVEYRDAWRVASSSLSSEIEKNFKFDPNNIEKHLIGLLKTIHKVYENDYRPEIAMIEEKLDSYWKEGIDAIRARRKNHR